MKYIFYYMVLIVLVFIVLICLSAILVLTFGDVKDVPTIFIYIIAGFAFIPISQRKNVFKWFDKITKAKTK